MFTTILRRLVRAVVFFFAAYAFVFMRLGEKTALEHVLAIVRTPQAQKAGAELKTGAERLVKKLREQASSGDEAGELPVRPRRRVDPGGRETERPLVGSAPAAPSAAAVSEH